MLVLCQTVSAHHTLGVFRLRSECKLGFITVYLAQVRILPEGKKCFHTNSPAKNLLFKKYDLSTEHVNLDMLPDCSQLDGTATR